MTARGTTVARVGVLILAIALSMAAHAQAARAYLDRDRIALGESATLSVETTANASPDYGPLVADFDLGAQGSRQQIDWVNGRMQSSSAYTLVLRPRHAGLLRVPPLRVGGQVTSPVSLLVTGAPSAAQANSLLGGDRDTFIESEADDQDPYVQQSVGWVVRLYTSVQAVSGELDQAEPANAGLQRIGNDLQYRRRVGGREYYVVERHYVLVPERSGQLVIPPAIFRGRGEGNVFDRMFGDGSVDLQAHAPPRVLRVRAIPVDAPQPWLPLRSLSLRYLETPQRLRSGSTSSLVVETQADGITAAQMPELALPASDGVQVFAERAQVAESIVDGRPHVRATRRFSLVPSRAGTLSLAGPSLSWWDVQAGRARTTGLPALALDVAPGDPMPAAAPQPGEPADNGPPALHRLHAWRWPIVIVIVALILIMVGMARRQKPRAVARSGAIPPPLPTLQGRGEMVPSSAAGNDSADPSRPGVIGDRAKRDAGVPQPDLARSLKSGELAEIENVLRSLAARARRGKADHAGIGDASVGSSDVDVMALLADTNQREALDRLRRARWAEGDAVAALASMRQAFVRGPSWRTQDVPPAPLLAPLYPPTRGRDHR